MESQETGRQNRILVVVVFCVILAKQVDPRPDLTSQKEVALIGQNLASINYGLPNVEVNTEIGSRTKRRADDKKGRTKNGGKRDKRRKKDNSKISAVHIVVNRHHPLVVGKPLLTGERGNLIAYWKYADFGFSKQQKIATLEYDGSVTIKRAGLYMIYSQMTYFDRTGRWSHTVGVNEKPFIKCLASEWGVETDPDTNVLYNTIHQCYTSAVIALQRGDKVGIYSMYPDRVMHEDKEMCFWGLVKLS